MIERQVEFDASLHSADAIQRAVYRLSDRLSCDLAADVAAFRCTIHLDPEEPDRGDALLAEFRNTVLDETLRERIRDDTKEVRNLILALAFSNTGLVDDDAAA
jgi:His-Xaa-Ser system protein HxsD